MFTSIPASLAPSTTWKDSFDAANTTVANALDAAYGMSIVWGLIVVLLGAGITFTVRTRGMQFRLFGHMFTTIAKSRQGAQGGISSFQAFAIGLADRVGTGNIAGVALAIVAGGAGAVFWMWVVALVGMATGFIEATLAQLFKVRSPDGTFRGGPAYYIQRGLGSRRWGIVFAVLLIFAYGFSFQMIQANTIAQVAYASYAIPQWVSALFLLAVTIPVIVGGIKPVAHITEYMAPIMALTYVVLAGAVIISNFELIPAVFGDIFAGAFGLRAAGGGALGAFFAALTQGTKRGLFTNEAGMGSAPNAAATATVKHPVQQGLIQSLGVFVDTMLVCTATAFIILAGGLYQPGLKADDGAALTTHSLTNSLGGWTVPLLLVIIFLFGYSTLLGNYAYAEANIKFLRGINASAWPIKIIVMVAVAIGSVLSLQAVWAIADWATALMAIVNLVALFALSKWAVGALADYQSQLRAGVPLADISFCSTNNPYLPADLPTDIWDDPQLAANRDAQTKTR